MSANSDQGLGGVIPPRPWLIIGIGYVVDGGVQQKLGKGIDITPS